MDKGLVASRQQAAPAPQGEQLDKNAELDAQIVVLMGKKMMDEQGLKALEPALKSADPAQVVGKFLAQMVMKMAESLVPQGINPKVFLAKGGFVDQMLDYIETKLGLPKDFSDAIVGEVMETIKAAMQAAQSGSQGPSQAPPQGGPPAPQQGGMTNG